MAFKMKNTAYWKAKFKASEDVSPFKQKPKFKDTKTYVAGGKGGSIEVVKGARSKVGDEGSNVGGTAGEKGKLTTYHDIKSGHKDTKVGKKNVVKNVYKKKKGAASGRDTWEHKKTKQIPQKRAFKQAKKALNQQTRQQERLNK